MENISSTGGLLPRGSTNTTNATKAAPSLRRTLVALPKNHLYDAATTQLLDPDSLKTHVPVFVLSFPGDSHDQAVYRKRALYNPGT